MADKLIAKAKVAGLVTESQLSFNAGSDAGIEEGDIVTLYRSVDVIDPDTKERLGGVDLVRLRLRVTLAAKKYSVARVIDRIPTTNPFAALTSLPPRKTVTLDELEESPEVVLVAVGERATIRRPNPDET